METQLHNLNFLIILLFFIFAFFGMAIFGWLIRITKIQKRLVKNVLKKEKEEHLNDKRKEFTEILNAEGLNFNAINIDEKVEITEEYLDIDISDEKGEPGVITVVPVIGQKTGIIYFFHKETFLNYIDELKHLR